MGQALRDAGYAQLAESVGEPPAGDGGLAPPARPAPFVMAIPPFV